MTHDSMTSSASKRPHPVVIGIPAYVHTCKDILGRVASAIPNSYIEALTRVDALPLIIPMVPERSMLKRLFEMIDGLMLIGGPDIDPQHYAQKAKPGLRKVTPARDALELMLTGWALKRYLPILAICRGIQLLNVAAGGSLWQDIANQIPGAQKHDQYPDHRQDYLAHTVDIEPQSRLAAICQKTQICVNSLHHQAIDRLGSGLTIVSRSEDGLIEAVEADGDQWVIGVQWHPEWMVREHTTMQNLFRAFRDACV